MQIDLTPDDIRACIQYAMDVLAVEDIRLASRRTFCSV